MSCSSKSILTILSLMTLAELREEGDGDLHGPEEKMDPPPRGSEAHAGNPKIQRRSSDPHKPASGTA